MNDIITTVDCGVSSFQFCAHGWRLRFPMRNEHTTPKKVRMIQVAAIVRSIIASILAIIETLCQWLL